MPDKKKITKLTDLVLDPANANVGTVRGAHLLDTSLERYGGGRSIVVDKHGYVIGGNKTLEMAVSRGLKIRVVESDGRNLVVVQRTDLDLAKDPAARELAYLDNRVNEVGLEWDKARIEADLASGLQLGAMFTQQEIDDILGTLEEIVRNTTLSFEDGPKFARWQRFQRFLETQYAHLGTPSAEFLGLAMDAWITEQLGELAAEAGPAIFGMEEAAGGAQEAEGGSEDAVH